MRLTHVRLEVGLLLWQAASIFLLLLACWELSSLLFSTPRARWSGVCLVAALLTIPVAGTALYIMDQYLNPRNLAAFAAVFAVVRTMKKKYAGAFLWLVFAALMHPLMWVFPFSFCILLFVMDQFEGWSKKTSAAGLALLVFPAIPIAPPPSNAYQEVAKLHSYFYIQNWAWYELLGIVAPLALFWWFGRWARKQRRAVLERISRAFVVYGLVFLVIALVVDLPARFEVLARLQPLRCLHLLYIVLFVVMGGIPANMFCATASGDGCCCSCHWAQECSWRSARSPRRARISNGRAANPEIRGHKRLSGFERTLQPMPGLRLTPNI